MVNNFKAVVSLIIPNAPKCSSRHFIVHRKCVSFEWYLSVRVPSKPSIVFSPQKPFYSQPNYSSWWLSICLVLTSSNLVNGVPRCKQKHGSGWNGFGMKFKNILAEVAKNLSAKTVPGLTVSPRVYYCLRDQHRNISSGVMKSMLSNDKKKWQKNSPRNNCHCSNKYMKLSWPFRCHVFLSKLHIKFAKTWTLFSDNVNTTIRKYSSRAFIWVVTSLDFVGQFRI